MLAEAIKQSDTAMAGAADAPLAPNTGASTPASAETAQGDEQEGR
jgi:hypothetical protein